MIVLIMDITGDKTINTMHNKLISYLFMYIAMSKEDKENRDNVIAERPKSTCFTVRRKSKLA